MCAPRSGHHGGAVAVSPAPLPGFALPTGAHDAGVPHATVIEFNQQTVRPRAMVAASNGDSSSSLIRDYAQFMSPTAVLPSLASFSEDGGGGGAGAGHGTGEVYSGLLDHFRHASTNSDIMCALENLLAHVKGVAMSPASAPGQVLPSTAKADVIAIGAEHRESRPGEWSGDVPRLFGELLRALSGVG